MNARVLALRSCPGCGHEIAIVPRFGGLLTLSVGNDGHALAFPLCAACLRRLGEPGFREEVEAKAVEWFLGSALDEVAEARCLGGYGYDEP